MYPADDDQVVCDAVAKVTWLADANLAKAQHFGTQVNSDGSMSHDAAVAWVKAMGKADWLGQRRWELPPGGGCGGWDCTTTPLGELYYTGLGLSQGQPVVRTPVTNLVGFGDLQPYLYWACSGDTVTSACRRRRRRLAWAGASPSATALRGRTSSRTYLYGASPPTTPSARRIRA